MAPFIDDHNDFISSGASEICEAAFVDKKDALIPIAVVGMSCRLPGDATNVENLWKMCVESRDAWGSIPEDRYNLEGHYHPDSNRAGSTYVHGGHFLTEDLAKFDARFFSITRDEAAAMDPQQRLMLECSYEALENAGIPVRQVAGSNTSVYMGSFCRDWTDILNRDLETLPFSQATGTGQALLANRLSYFYDLKGPSVSIDTACSSSLVAVHLACQSLRTGESKQAIVGGANVILSHETTISMSRMRFLSSSGRSYTYDHRADGYSRGEGAACVILKPLAEAIKNGDTIRGIIRNTGTNQDGRTNGITLPSSEAQESLIRSVYERAGLDPLRTSYVETHGTATQAGDPLEAAALSRVFGPGRPQSEPLICGSIKTNIGHTEGASGLAGLIKTILMLESGLILPNLNFETANERIPLHEWKLKVPTTIQPWPAYGVRRASVCNYGYGGSNAHLIIDGASHYLSTRSLKASYNTIPSTNHRADDLLYPLPEDQRARIFVLSAFDEVSGKDQAQRLTTYLNERGNFHNQALLDNLAFTLTKRRSNLPYKVAVLASSVSQLVEALSGEDLKYSKASKAPALGFVFTGQGAQWHAMGRELIEVYPVFRRSLSNASKYLTIFGASWSLLDELSKNAEESHIGLGYLSQPLCTAVQLALVDLLASWNIRPSRVTGHSSGEIAAAYAAGALSQESALAIAYYRGLAAPAIKQKYPHRKGAMLAVGLSQEETQAMLLGITSGRAVVACINSPLSVTVSGDESAIDELLELLQAKKIFARKLSVEVAYHSHHMDCVGDDYLAALQRIQIESSKKAEFYSSVTGQRLDLSELGPSYWVRNMLSCVEFSDSLRNLCLDLDEERHEGGINVAVDVLIELGPHSALAGPIKQILQADPSLRSSSIRYASVLVRNKSAVESSLQMVGQLFKTGQSLDFDQLNNPHADTGLQTLVDLPTYAWNHSEAYWAESRESRVYRSRPFPRSDILGTCVRNALPLQPRWRNYIRPAEIPWVRDHRIQSNIVYPAGGFIAMAIEAASQQAVSNGWEVSGYKLREITIGHALVVPEDEVETMLCLRPCGGGSRLSPESWSEFAIFSVTGTDNWTQHCRGLISVQKQMTPNDIDGQRLADQEKAFYGNMIAEAEDECLKNVDVKQLYNDLKAGGLHYGPTFAIMDQAWAAPYQSIGTILVPDTAAVMPSNYQHPFVVYPGTLDGCIQVLLPGMAEAEGPIQEAAMPTFIEEMFVSSRISREPNHEFKVYAKSEKTNARQSTSCIRVFDTNEIDFDPIISFTGLTCLSLPKSSLEDSPPDPRQLCFRTKWAASPDFLSSSHVGDICRADLVPGRYNNIATYVDLLAHKNPYLNCLEINAGSGDLTRLMLQVLGDSDKETPKFTMYDSTNATGATFEEMKAKTTAWSSLASFKKLEIENDPLKQGFEQESYDLIVYNVATIEAASIRRALDSIKKLVKVEGTLIIQKPSEVFLPNETDWNSLLRQTGYSDVSISMKETFTGKERHHAMMVAKPVINGNPEYPEVVIITDTKTDCNLTKSLETFLSESGLAFSTVSLSDAILKGKNYIFLNEITRNVLKSPTSAQYDAIRRLLSESIGMLWVTRGATIESDSPDSNLIAGLARTMRLESSSTIVTLDLDPRTPFSPETAARAIIDVFKRNFVVNGQGRNLDVEYSQRNGVIMIPRIVEDKTLNEFVSSTTEESIPEDQPYSQADRPLVADLRIPSQLDSLCFIDDVTMSQQLPDGYVEIEVKASGISSRDVSAATSKGASEPLGHECTGLITGIGNSVVQALKIGNRVVCHARGTLRNFIRLPATSVQILPDNISFKLGASIPVAYTTAYHALFKVADLEKNDTVLIHEAAGSVGQACVELCQMIRSEAFVTVRNLKEKNFIIEHFRIPEDHVFSSQDDGFSRGILRMTGGKGVDVIISSVSGEPLRLTWQCLGSFGRLVDLTPSPCMEVRRSSKNITFAAVDLNELLKERPEQAVKAFAKVVSLIEQGRVRPPQKIITFGMAEVATALRTMQTENHIGSLVLMPRPDDMVKVMPLATSQNLFRVDSSYLLVGGLGGLGRAMATWMVHHGARNLVFASRSGLAKQSSRDLVDELNSKGAKVAVFSCDVSKVEQIDDLLAECSTTMPPIRGMIQAAMVIKNSFFQNMSLADYTASLAPKVQGTWNLHNRLPKDTLDFFILLSSAVGTIGNASQAAYAAASTFQDAFASYRTQLGLPAVSLDLGMINEVGYVAENKSVQQGLEKLGFEGVSEKELMAMLHSAIVTPLRSTSSSSSTPPPSSSIISGLGTYNPSSPANNPAFLDPRFSHFRRLSTIPNPSTSTTTSPTESLQNALTHASSPDSAAQLISEAIIDKMAHLLMISREEISANKAMAEYGVDSLVAVQMRAWLTLATGVTVSVLELLAGVTIREFAGGVAKRRVIGMR